MRLRDAVQRVRGASGPPEYAIGRAPRTVVRGAGRVDSTRLSQVLTCTADLTDREADHDRLRADHSSGGSGVLHPARDPVVEAPALQRHRPRRGDRHVCRHPPQASRAPPGVGAHPCRADLLPGRRCRLLHPRCDERDDAVPIAGGCPLPGHVPARDLRTAAVDPPDLPRSRLAVVARCGDRRRRHLRRARRPGHRHVCGRWLDGVGRTA